MSGPQPASGWSGAVYRFGLFEFDPVTRELRRGGMIIRIQDQPAAILALLLKTPGEVVTRERLRAEIWHNRSYGDFESGLNTAMSKLRSGLRDSAEGALYVETIPKVGYRFAAPVSFAVAPRLVEMPRRPPVSPTEPVASSTPTLRLIRPARWIALGILLGVVISITAWRLIGPRVGSVAEWIGNSHPVTSFPGGPKRPALSPDGKTVAFDWRGPQGDNLDIYLMRLGDDQPSRLTSGSADETYPVWSPDGGEVAFIRAGEKHAVSICRRVVLGASERIVARLDRAPEDRPRLDWSRDGRFFLSSERSGAAAVSRIVIVDSASGAKRVITSPPATTLGDSEAAFSSDGKLIAFRRTIRSGIEDVYVIAASGQSERRVTFDNRAVSGLCWRPDDKALIVSSRRGPVASSRQLWEVPLAGDPLRLTSGTIDADGPAMSPDGKQIVYVQSVTNTNIYEVDLRAGGAPRPLIVAADLNGDPQYSPDGSRIAFRSSRSGVSEFWVASRDGANPVRITDFNGKSLGSARWSPDGRQLVLNAITATKDSLFLVNADGTGFHRLTEDSVQAANPVWSHDGKHVYFASNRSGTSQIWRVPTDLSSPPIQVTAMGGNVPAGPYDSRTLYYDRRRPAGIFAVDLDSTLPAEGRLIAVPSAHNKWAVTKTGVYFLIEDPTFSERLRIKFIPHGTKVVRDIGPVPRQHLAIDGTFAVSPDDHFALFGLLDRSGSSLILARKSANGLLGRF